MKNKALLLCCLLAALSARLQYGCRRGQGISNEVAKIQGAAK